MAEFSGKIVDAVYVNEEYSIVKIRYEDSAGNLAVYNLEANPDDEDYKALVAEGWDSEKILDATVEFKQAQSLAYNIEIENAAKIMLEEKFGEDFSSASNSNSSGSILWEDFLELNEDKDEIFKFKIWAFESEAMKTADADVKRALRKAPTLMKAIAIYDTML
jgi:hypothetical protein